MRALAAGELAPPPIAVLLNMGPVEIAEGRVVFEGEPTLAPGVGYSTLTLETKFVRAITRDTGLVRCEAEVLHRGRRQATASAGLVDAASGKLLAHGTGTCLIIG